MGRGFDIPREEAELEWANEAPPMPDPSPKKPAEAVVERLMEADLDDLLRAEPFLPINLWDKYRLALAAARKSIEQEAELAKAAKFFREEEPSLGFEGDVESRSSIDSLLKLARDRKAELATLRAQVERQVIDFASAVQHGDSEHRAWLMEAAAAFVRGKPIPPVRAALSDPRRDDGAGG